MKKILFLLLLSVACYGQTSTGQETDFDYGIKNNAAQEITTPTYLTTTGVDGTQGKIPSAYIEKTANKDNGTLTTSTTTYPTSGAVKTVTDLKENVANKQDNLNVDGTATKYPTVDIINKVVSFVTPEQFGAVGDGITDDTAAIQSALSSTSKNIIFAAGKTYLIDGGLTTSVTDRTINFTGATIKLKNSATNKGMLSVTGAYTSVIGGTWDGNKANGNSPADTYTSRNILINANNCTVKNIVSINTFGIGIQGAGTISYAVFENNNISGTDHYGIFIDSNGTVDQIGNRAINNIIDSSTNATRGQGILFTSVLASGFYQRDWEILGNKITGSQTTTTDQAICLAVRGHNGIFSNNITRYGSMGISEGGDNTIYSNNIISDCPTGSVSYGIEITGSNCLVIGNVIKNVTYGILGANLTNYDNANISGNIIVTHSTGIGVSLQIADGYTGKDINISANNIYAKTGISTVRDVSGLLISGNTIKGQGSGVVNGRGIFLDTPLVNGNGTSIIGNKFSELERAFAIYSLDSATFTNFSASGNDLSKNVGSSEGGWTFEGLAVAGNHVSSSWGVSSVGNRKHIIDQTKNTFIMWSDNYNNPEGVLIAGIGSVFYSLNSSGGAYYKNTGTGNTGWRSVVTGTGTTNYIPKITSGGAIDNSQVFDDGTNVGIGTATPSVKLAIYGAHVSGQGMFKLDGITSAYSTYNAATGFDSGFFFNKNSANKWYVNNQGSDDSFNITSRDGGDNKRLTFLQNGNAGFGTVAPTAIIHLKAGTTAANTAPLKFNTGALMTTPEAGAVEFLTDKWYGTITTGAARKTFAFLESPTFTGTPTAPTAAPGTNTTEIATTAFVQEAVTSGTYTPTLTNTTNISSSTLNAAYYTRVGDIVTVTIAAQVTLTTTADTVLTFSLPISGATIVNGIGQGNLTSGGGAVNAYGIVDTTNSTTAQLRIGSTAVAGSGAGVAAITFTYSL